MDDLYRDYILEHSRHPHNFGVLEQPTASHEGANPLCGDRITMQLGIRDGKVAEVAFTGRGCAISQASASLLTDEVKGMTVDEAATASSRRPARAARDRHQPGAAQVRDAQPRHARGSAGRCRRGNVRGAGAGRRRGRPA